MVRMAEVFFCFVIHAERDKKYENKSSTENILHLFRYLY
jgi:hypothetical protein